MTSSRETEVSLGRYRNWLSIFEEILTIALEGATTTHIVYRANITFTRFHRYASFLLERGLLVQEDGPGGTIYKTTEKGRNFLACMRKVRELLAVPPHRAASP